MIKFGYNIDAGAIEDRGYLIDVLRKTKSRAHLVMAAPPPNDDARKEIEQSVIRLRDEVGNAQTKYIYRRYSPHEGDWHKFDVEAEARRWEKEGHKEIIRQDPANEPGLTDNAEYVKSRVRLLELAYNLGITVCVGTWGVGGPHHEEIKKGTYDDLIRALARYGGMLDVHEYVPIMPEFGAQYGYEMILNPLNYRDLEVHTPWPVAEGHWLARRIDFWMLRADEIGVKRPLFNLSEVLWDKIPDAETKLNNQGGKWDAFQKKYGSGPAFNNDIRGVLTLENVFRTAYPNMPYSVALFHTWKRWYEMLYEKRPEVFAMQMFQWGKLWRYPAGHDVSARQVEPFVMSIAQYSQTRTDLPDTTPPPPPPPPEPEIKMVTRAITSAAAGWTNIRTQPRVSGEPIGRIPTRLKVKLSEKPIKGENYGPSDQWYKIELGGRVGYIAAYWVSLDPKLELALQYEDILPELLAARAASAAPDSWERTDPREFDEPAQRADDIEARLVWGLLYGYLIFVMLIMILGALSSYFGWGV